MICSAINLIECASVFNFKPTGLPNISPHPRNKLDNPLSIYIYLYKNTCERSEECFASISRREVVKRFLMSSWLKLRSFRRYFIVIIIIIIVTVCPCVSALI